jgi:cell division initiation protein
MSKVSAVDIQHKIFRKGLLGYDRVEVDRFLEDLMESVEDEAINRAQLEKELAEMRDRLAHFKAMEDALQGTLLLAQRTADEVKAAAHQKADLIIAEARAVAAREANVLEARMNNARRECEQALQLAERSKHDLRGMLNMYTQMLEKPSLLQIAGDSLGTGQGMIESVSSAPLETQRNSLSA